MTPSELQQLPPPACLQGEALEAEEDGAKAGLRPAQAQEGAEGQTGEDKDLRQVPEELPGRATRRADGGCQPFQVKG